MFPIMVMTDHNLGQFKQQNFFLTALETRILEAQCETELVPSVVSG